MRWCSWIMQQTSLSLAADAECGVPCEHSNSSRRSAMYGSPLSSHWIACPTIRCSGSVKKHQLDKMHMTSNKMDLWYNTLGSVSLWRCMKIKTHIFKPNMVQNKSWYNLFKNINALQLGHCSCEWHCRICWLQFKWNSNLITWDGVCIMALIFPLSQDDTVMFVLMLHLHNPIWDYST